jgi:hypothetical protein
MCLLVCECYLDCKSSAVKQKVCVRDLFETTLLEITQDMSLEICSTLYELTEFDIQRTMQRVIFL